MVVNQKHLNLCKQKSTIVSKSELSAGNDGLDIEDKNSSSHKVHKQKKYAYRVIKNPHLPAYHSDVRKFPYHNIQFITHQNIYTLN